MYIFYLRTTRVVFMIFKQTRLQDIWNIRKKKFTGASQSLRNTPLLNLNLNYEKLQLQR